MAVVTFEPRLSGLGKRIGLVARELRATGTEVVVILPAREGNLSIWLERLNIRCRRVKIGQIPKPTAILAIAAWLLRMPAEVFRLRKVLLEEGVAIAHVNGSFFFGPAIAARLAGLRLIWHLNDTIIPARLARWVGAFIVRWSGHVVLAAEAVGYHYGIQTSDRVSVIYAPVEVTDSTPHNTADDGVTHVGLIGNISPVKGVEYFVEAAAQVKKALALPVRFSIAGAELSTQAAYTARIKELIRQRGLNQYFQLLGFHEELDPYLEGLTVLVLSSRSEACPMAVLEAMAAGVPVVAFDVGGVRELLEAHGKCGIVVPQSDTRALAQAVIRLLKTPELRHRFAATGRLVSQQYFSLEVCVRAHHDLYMRMIQAMGAKQ